MKQKLSPQKTIIVSVLRDMQWHCGRTWLNQIKDDRKRISELNEGYMLEKGYTIEGVPCKGTACGVRDCPLYKRRAVKVTDVFTSVPPKKPKLKAILVGGNWVAREV